MRQGKPAIVNTHGTVAGVGYWHPDTLREHNQTDSSKENARNARERLPCGQMNLLSSTDSNQPCLLPWDAVTSPSQLFPYLCLPSPLIGSVTDTDLSNKVCCGIAFALAMFLWPQCVQNVSSHLCPFIRSQNMGNITFNLTSMGKYKPSWCCSVSSISDSLHNCMAHS